MIKKIIIILFSILFIILILIILIGGGIGAKTNYPSLNNLKPVVFGHRGGVNDLFVENSLEAFDKGLNLGFNGIETDVRLSKDGELIIYHDDSFLRLLGVDENVENLNWLDISTKKLLFNGKETSNTVLLLKDFLNHIPDSIIVYLDVKVSSFKLADKLLELLKTEKFTNKILIGDEDIVFLSYVKYKEPSINIVLEGYNKGKEWTHYIIPKNFKPDYYSSHFSEVDRNHIAFLKKNNLLSNRIVYGVQLANISQVLELGIPNVIYDYDSLGLSLSSLKEQLDKTKN